MITCTAKCIYEKEGLCALEHAASTGTHITGGGCGYRIEKETVKREHPERGRS